jgi:hypothetical protein
MLQEERRDALVQAARAAPSLFAVVVTKFMDLPVEKWLALSGIGFIALQGVHLLWRWNRDWRGEL